METCPICGEESSRDIIECLQCELRGCWEFCINNGLCLDCESAEDELEAER